jgi:hypothetical protein
VGASERGDGADAEVSGLRGGLCCDYYGCGDFGFGGGALAAVGDGALWGGADLDGGEAFVEDGSGLLERIDIYAPWLSCVSCKFADMQANRRSFDYVLRKSAAKLRSE